MSLSTGKVGVAPGTTTLNIRDGGVSLLGAAQQDPGVIIRNIEGRLMGADLGYFDAKPTDFDLSKIYGYTPVHRGWNVGILSGGLGEEVATLEPALNPQEQKAIAQLVMNQLTLESKSLELKMHRSARFWGAIAGLATITTATVAVLAHIRSR